MGKHLCHVHCPSLIPRAGERLFVELDLRVPHVSLVRECIERKACNAGRSKMSFGRTEEPCRDERVACSVDFSGDPIETLTDLPSCETPFLHARQRIDE
jgi:hypothetical protein